MTDNKLLELIEALADVDASTDGELAQKRIRMIYRFVHGNSIDCSHVDWQREAQEQYDILKKSGSF